MQDRIISAESGVGSAPSDKTPADEFIGARRFHEKRGGEEDQRIEYIKRLIALHREGTSLEISLPPHAVIERGTTDEGQPYQYLVMVQPGGDVNEVELTRGTDNKGRLTEWVSESYNGVQFHTVEMRAGDEFVEYWSDEKGPRVRHAMKWNPDELSPWWSVFDGSGERPVVDIEATGIAKELAKKFHPLDPRGGILWGGFPNTKTPISDVTSCLPEKATIVKSFPSENE